MRMDCFKILTLFILGMALQEGCGLPISHQPELSTEALNPHRVRAKRCSCNNWEDKECIYFCHLDIIWVNTPSKLLPYGLGSPPSRRRRSAAQSADRCQCLNPADKGCRGFCRKSSEDHMTDLLSPPVESTSTSSNKLLKTFRSVVNSNMATAKRLLSPKTNSLDTLKLNSLTRR